MPQNAVEADLFRRAVIVTCCLFAAFDTITGVLVLTDTHALAGLPAFQRSLSWLPAWAWGTSLIAFGAGMLWSRTRVWCFATAALWYAAWGVGLVTNAGLHYLIGTYGTLTGFHVLTCAVLAELHTTTQANQAGRAQHG